MEILRDSVLENGRGKREEDLGRENRTSGAVGQSAFISMLGCEERTVEREHNGGCCCKWMG